MKRLSVYKVSVSFAGAFLGAGYISGQELWQFFGSFGVKGLLGIVLSMALIVLFGIALSYVVTCTGLSEVDKILVPWKSLRWVRRLAGVFQLLLIFGVTAIMIAGAGALLLRLFSLPSSLGSALVAALVAYAAIRGIQGVVKVFSLIVPLMVGITVTLSITAIAQYGLQLPAGTSIGESNPLIGSAAVGTILYAFYNFFGTIGILAPLAKECGSHRVYRLGVLFGTCILTLIALAIVTAELSIAGIASTELPMLELAFQMNRPIGYLYGLLLIASMFSAAVSMTVSLLTYLTAKSSTAMRHSKRVCIAIACCAFAGSLLGFNELIGTIYPVLGYGGSIFIVCMLISAAQLRLKNKRVRQTEGE